MPHGEAFKNEVRSCLSVLERPVPITGFEPFDQVLAKGAAEKRIAELTGIPRREVTPARIRSWLAIEEGKARG
jgi:hypothetical protein